MERAPPAALPPGLRWELTDLVARLSAVRARIAQIAAALVIVAAPLSPFRGRGRSGNLGAPA